MANRPESDDQAPVIPELNTLAFYALVSLEDQIARIKESISPQNPDFVSDDAAYLALVYCQSLVVRNAMRIRQPIDVVTVPKGDETQYDADGKINVQLDESGFRIHYEFYTGSVHEGEDLSFHWGDQEQSVAAAYSHIFKDATGGSHVNRLEQVALGQYGRDGSALDEVSLLARHEQPYVKIPLFYAEGAPSLHGVFLQERFHALALHIEREAQQKGIEIALTSSRRVVMIYSMEANFMVEGCPVQLESDADRYGDVAYYAIGLYSSFGRDTEEAQHVFEVADHVGAKGNGGFLRFVEVPRGPRGTTAPAIDAATNLLLGQIRGLSIAEHMHR